MNGHSECMWERQTGDEEDLKWTKTSDVCVFLNKEAVIYTYSTFTYSFTYLDLLYKCVSIYLHIYIYIYIYTVHSLWKKKLFTKYVNHQHVVSYTHTHTHTHFFLDSNVNSCSSHFFLVK